MKNNVGKRMGGLSVALIGIVEDVFLQERSFAQAAVSTGEKSSRQRSWHLIVNSESMNSKLPSKADIEERDQIYAASRGVADR